MDIRRYEAFVAAVDTGSMSGAAKQLGYTPSGIIRLINALEGELGFSLLVRSAGGVTVTPEGQRILPYFKQMCQTERLVNSTAERIRGLAEGTLTIGALSSLASYWLPAVISKYQKKFPNVKVNIVGGSNARQLELLESRDVDCCLCHGPVDRFVWEPLGKQQTVVWAHRSSPLLKHPEVLLAELDGVPFIMTNPDDDSLYQELFYSKGLEPDIRFTTSGWRTTYSMVDQGLGASLCCGGIAKNLPGNVDERPLSPPRYLEFGVATAPGTTPAVEEFLEIARTYAGQWPLI